jgi:hypothetical protein
MKGSCHCGAVAFEVSEPPTELTECNCSLCRRLGGRWAYYLPDQLRILRGADSLVPYVQGDRILAMHHCRTCGCSTHWVGLPGTEVAPDGENPRVCINARLLEDFDLDSVPIRKVDGASF